MNQCSFKLGLPEDLPIDDSGHRKKSGDAGVGRRYIGEIGKLTMASWVVTTHLYDGDKSLPLDLELYRNASTLPGESKTKNFCENPKFKFVRPELGLLRAS